MFNWPLPHAAGRAAQGAALHLTHWRDNATPARYYADTSAEITARFVVSDEAAAYADAVVVNNHYDTDGCAPACIALMISRQAHIALARCRRGCIN